MELENLLESFRQIQSDLQLLLTSMQVFPSRAPFKCAEPQKGEKDLTNRVSRRKVVMNSALYTNMEGNHSSSGDVFGVFNQFVDVFIYVESDGMELYRVGKSMEQAHVYAIDW